ncbi:MAG TPA: hypothetical protein VLM39_06315, partial [Ignavibacteriaceae bacterium]|nr:hypothetical protein [Ignavibacteriaceae bacterium]
MNIERTNFIALLFTLSFSTYLFAQVIYSNSFETPQDTVGLQRYGSIMFSNDVPPDGGTQSLYVSGG